MTNHQSILIACAVLAGSSGSAAAAEVSLRPLAESTGRYERIEFRIETEATATAVGLRVAFPGFHRDLAGRITPAR